MEIVFCFAPSVGAYAIRPVRHRISRIANRYCDIANPRNSGRMPYAPTAAQLVGWHSLECLYCVFIWHNLLIICAFVVVGSVVLVAFQ